MSELLKALQSLVDPARWAGDDGYLSLLGEHLLVTVVVIAIALAIAVPIGWLIGHTGRGRDLIVAVSGAARALPTLGLLTLVALWLGLGLAAPIIALTVLAVPPILAGAYSGFQAIDRSTVDAARAQGHSEWQILWRIEVPLGLPLLMGGIRSAVLQVVATATLAAITGSGGLGTIIFVGLNLGDYARMIVGSILVIALTLVLDALLALAERLTVPTGVIVAQRLERGAATA